MKKYEASLDSFFNEIIFTKHKIVQEYYTLYSTDFQLHLIFLDLSQGNDLRMWRTLKEIWWYRFTLHPKRHFTSASTNKNLPGISIWFGLVWFLYGNYTRMLRAILNKSWRQHPTRHQLYGHLPPITKTIQVREARHAGHCWRNRDELISDILLWTPAYGQAKGRPARTYAQQLCEDTGCSPEDLPEAMNDREKWRERVKDIRASGIWWWWWWWFNGISTIVGYLMLKPLL